MGFDLSGVNPKMNMKQKELPVSHKYDNMDWSEKNKVLDTNQKLREQYWKEHEKYISQSIPEFKFSDSFKEVL